MNGWCTVNHMKIKSNHEIQTLWCTSYSCNLYSSTKSESQHTAVPEDVHSGLQATNLFFQCHGACDGVYHSKGLGCLRMYKSLAPKKESYFSLKSTQSKTMMTSPVLNLGSFASLCVRLSSFGNFLHHVCNRSSDAEHKTNAWINDSRSKPSCIHYEESVCMTLGRFWTGMNWQCDTNLHHVGGSWK